MLSNKITPFIITFFILNGDLQTLKSSICILFSCSERVKAYMVLPGSFCGLPELCWEISVKTLHQTPRSSEIGGLMMGFRVVMTLRLFWFCWVNSVPRYRGATWYHNCHFRCKKDKLRVNCIQYGNKYNLMISKFLLGLVYILLSVYDYWGLGLLMVLYVCVLYFFHLNLIYIYLCVFLNLTQDVKDHFHLISNNIDSPL